MKNIRKQDLLQLVYGIVIIVLLNIISSFLFTRFDLTSEKRYSLSPATKKLVKGLDDVVYVKVYLEGEFPAGFKRLRNATKEILDELRAYSGDNIEYEFINPSESSDPKTRTLFYRQLAEKGLQPTSLQSKEKGQSSQQIVFPGAVISYKGTELPLQLLKSQIGAPPEEMLNNSIEGLEYDFARVIRDLTIKNKPRIGFIEGHGELDALEVADVSRTLAESYEVSRIRINGQLDALKNFKAVIVAGPDSAFTEKDKFILDQYIMKGGKVLWLVDGIRASMDSLQKSPTTVGVANEVNLNDQIFRYGVRINYNLVMDLQAAPIPIVTGMVGNQPRQSLLPWYFFPLMSPVNNHPVINNLNAIKGEFASSIDTVSAPEVKKTVLLTTSRFTKFQNAPARISLGEVREEPDPRTYNKGQQMVAVLLDGTFRSVFKNRIPAEIAQSKDIGYKELSVPTKMIVVSDGDVIRNEARKSTGQILPLGYDRYTGQTYGNKNFVLNAVDYLVDESGLITVRSKEFKLRLLDRTKVNEEKTKWQLINVLGPIIVILLFGIIQTYIRRRKYTR